MLKLRGGETLNKQKEVQKYNLADALVDMRYYPFKPTLPENVSTDTAEFVTYEAKSLTSNILEFEVEPSTSGYLDLANSYIMINSKLQYNGADLSFNVPNQRILAEPWQSLLMFKDVKTYVNNKEVSDQHDGGIYPYTALHKALLTEKNCDPVIVGTQSQTQTEPHPSFLSIPPTRRTATRTSTTGVRPTSTLLSTPTPCFLKSTTRSTDSASTPPALIRHNHDCSPSRRHLDAKGLSSTVIATPHSVCQERCAQGCSF